MKKLILEIEIKIVFLKRLHIPLNVPLLTRDLNVTSKNEYDDDWKCEFKRKLKMEL